VFQTVPLTTDALSRTEAWESILNHCSQSLTSGETGAAVGALVAMVSSERRAMVARTIRIPPPSLS
jgi:hypothetical protein